MRFVHDGGEAAPAFSVAVGDGSARRRIRRRRSPSPMSTTRRSWRSACRRRSRRRSCSSGHGVFGVSDPDTAPSQLVYSVSGDAERAVRGRRNPGVAVLTFTQAQVDAGEIRLVQAGSARRHSRLRSPTARRRSDRSPSARNSCRRSCRPSPRPRGMRRSSRSCSRPRSARPRPTRRCGTSRVERVRRAPLRASAAPATVNADVAALLLQGQGATSSVDRDGAIRAGRIAAASRAGFAGHEAGRSEASSFSRARRSRALRPTPASSSSRRRRPKRAAR